MTPPLGPVSYSAVWLIVVTAAVIIGQSLRIALSYWRLLGQLRAKDRRRPAGLRAWHICTIAVVFAGYAFMVAVGVLELIGMPVIPRSARLVAYAVLNSLGIVSLILIAAVVADRARSLANIPARDPATSPSGTGTDEPSAGKHCQRPPSGT